MKMLAALLLLAPLVAFAEEEKKEVLIAKLQSGDWLRIYMEPCPVSSGWLKLQRAHWFYKGKNYDACWMVLDVKVLVHDESGEVAGIPIKMFELDEGV